MKSNTYISRNNT